MEGFYSLPDEEALREIGRSQDFLLYDPADQLSLQPDHLFPPFSDLLFPSSAGEAQPSNIPDANAYTQEQIPTHDEAMAADSGMLKPLEQDTQLQEPRHSAWTLPDAVEGSLAGPSNSIGLEQEIAESAEHQQCQSLHSQAMLDPSVEASKSPLECSQAHSLEHACPYAGCDRRFDNAKSLKNHKKRCESGKTPRHKCDTCQKAYWHPKDKLRCINKHLKAKVQCPGCQRLYSRRDNMIRHLTAMHPGLRIPAVADSSPSIKGLTLRSVSTPRSAANSFQTTSFESGVGCHYSNMSPLASGAYQLSASPTLIDPAVSMVRTISNNTSFMDVDSTFSVFESETPLTVPDSLDHFIDPQLLQQSLQLPSKWSGPLF